MSIKRINQYYLELEDIYRFSGKSNETSIQNAFYNLLNDYAKSKNLLLVPQVTIPNSTKRPDGALFDAFKFNYGYWEAKDSNDDLELEIQNKINIGYPTENIIFEDSKTIVLLQGSYYEKCNMKDPKALDKILNKFVSYIRIEVYQFREALNQFTKDIPQIVEVLGEMIKEQVISNIDFNSKRSNFFDLCKKVINPNITYNNIDEMLIQHILTEEIFNSIINERQFHEDNNIAKMLSSIEKTFFVKDTKRNVLSKLNPYYEAVRLKSTSLTTYDDKQDFLKTIYENFYKAYNPSSADTLGIVYTPSEIVNFMIEGVDFLLEKHFNKNLFDKNVEILDPATGTGTFITSLIKYIPNQYLEYKYENEIHANEIGILPYYIANLNIEYIYKQKMNNYKEFKNLCFVDTLENIQGLKIKETQASLFDDGFAENSLRIESQNNRKISVIIGNPPYNSNQQNENDNNKNRSYPFIDAEIKKTFIEKGVNQKSKVYDAYARFYRWSMDRIDKVEGGIIAFITNRSFIDSKTFSGFRKYVKSEFSEIYIVDLLGDVRQNNPLEQGGNVFNIMTGVAIAFLIRKPKNEQNVLNSKIYYHNIGFGLKGNEKLEILKENRLENLEFEYIKPDIKHNWINLSSNDFESLIQVCSKNVKLGKTLENSIFKTYSNGVSSNRDEWVYDLNLENLENKMNYFYDEYNSEVERWIQWKIDNNYTDIKDESNLVLDKFLEERNLIKWSNRLKRDKLRKHKLGTYTSDDIKMSTYRPFVKKYLHCGYIPIDLRGEFDTLISNENLFIVISNGARTNLIAIATNCITDLNLYVNTPAVCLPLYSYDRNGNRIDNITDWCLEEFQNKTNDKNITKIDIFNYIYGIFHDENYKQTYKQNLKRDFPRIPIKDFWKYSNIGKELMNIHINYEDFDTNQIIKDYNIKLNISESTDKIPLLKVNKNNEIELDSFSKIYNIPLNSFDYKFGNRSVIHWILDQYKPYKSKDKTIQENFNNYDFTIYKDEIIQLLLKCIKVSVETTNLINSI